MVRRSEHPDALTRENYFRSCRSCHGNHRHAAMSIEEMLAMKLLYDSLNYDVQQLRFMRTQKIDEKEIEEFYEKFLRQQQKGKRK